MMYGGCVSMAYKYQALCVEHCRRAVSTQRLIKSRTAVVEQAIRSRITSTTNSPPDGTAIGRTAPQLWCWVGPTGRCVEDPVSSYEICTSWLMKIKQQIISHIYIYIYIGLHWYVYQDLLNCVMHLITASSYTPVRNVPDVFPFGIH